jgi:hypothetical protein
MVEIRRYHPTAATSIQLPENVVDALRFRERMYPHAVHPDHRQVRP